MHPAGIPQVSRSHPCSLPPPAADRNSSGEEEEGVAAAAFMQDFVHPPFFFFFLPPPPSVPFGSCPYGDLEAEGRGRDCTERQIIFLLNISGLSFLLKKYICVCVCVCGILRRNECFPRSRSLSPPSLLGGQTSSDNGHLSAGSQSVSQSVKQSCLQIPSSENSVCTVAVLRSSSSSSSSSSDSNSSLYGVSNCCLVVV